MNINQSQASKLYAEGMMEYYSDYSAPTSLLESFFPRKKTSGLYVPWSVKRTERNVAEEVPRGTEGDNVKANKTSEKRVKPPYVKLATNLTELDAYPLVFRPEANFSPRQADVNALVQQTLSVIDDIGDMISLFATRQVSQFLNTGILNFSTIDPIDYRRKTYAGTLAAIDSTTGLGLYSVQGGDKATTANNNFIVISQKVLNFMRIQGKMVGGGNVIGIFGEEVVETILNTTAIKERINFRRADLINFKSPKLMSTGGVFHGVMTIGSYNVEIWTYPDGYNDPTTGVYTDFLGAKDVHYFAPTFSGQTAFADVPFVPGSTTTPFTNSSTIAKRYMNKIQSNLPGVVPFMVIKPEVESHKFGLKACPVAMPFSIDQVASIIGIIA